MNRQKMPFILIYATDSEAIKKLRMHKKNCPQLHVAQLSGKIFILVNNGEALTYATNLYLKHKGWVEIFIVEPLTLTQIPNKVRRAAEWRIEKPRGTYPTKEETLQNQNLPSLEDLRNIRLSFSMSSNEDSSESLNVQDLMKRLFPALQETKKNSKES